MTALSASDGRPRSIWPAIRSWLVQAALLAALWWILTDGAAGSWLVGAPVIAVLATFGALKAGPSPMTWSPGGLLLFLPYFLWTSLLGAADVARRAFRPRLALDPVFHDHAIRLSTEPARVFFANAVSLLPGTLSAELRDGHLIVHALDAGRPVGGDLARLEDKVARLFDQSIRATGESGE